MNGQANPLTMLFPFLLAILSINAAVVMSGATSATTGLRKNASVGATRAIRRIIVFFSGGFVSGLGCVGFGVSGHVEGGTLILWFSIS